MTVHTVIGLLDSRGMIALLVERGGKLEDTSGTVLDTISAPLAAIFKDINNATGNLYFFCIKWNPPKNHGIFLENK